MFDLSSYNTFNLHVSAREGIEIKCTEDLLALDLPLSEPYIILGGGSDVLFTEDFDGLVLINRILGIDVQKVELSPSTMPLNELDQAELFYEVRVGGGVVLDDLIVGLLQHGICGLENLSLIPGTVGAAPIQNIGAYGVEIGDFISSLETINLRTGEKRIFTHDECQFGYRYSIFKEPDFRSFFITHVNLRLSNSFVPQQNYAGLQSNEFKDAFAMRDRVISLRNEKLPNPKYVGNAGSFFKNPYVSKETVEKLQDAYEGKVPCYLLEDGNYKLAAGWLIDKAQCRGLRHGQVGTWGKQALVIVNLGNAKPHEVVALARYVSAEVKSKFGIDLVPEVRLYGKHGELAWDQI